MINTSDIATQNYFNDHSMSLKIQSISNSNFILLSFMMSMYLLTVGYYLILLTEWFIHKLVAKRHSLYNNNNCVDDNSPTMIKNQQDDSNNNNSVIYTTTTNNESSQQQLINSECTLSETPENTNSNNNQHENDESLASYIHPDLSPSSVTSTSESIFTSKPATETVQAESLLTIFKELVQRVIDIEKEWTRIISSQLENSKLVYYHDSSDSSLCCSNSSSSSSDDYCYESGRTTFQNVRMRRTAKSPTMKRMNSFQFPRGINFAL
ncbi:predicted protein [Naegleria gruberi]|uniref:Predicted protein n=1 Tax=Naegleria gruberi TaxID=5762 RepID=D2W2T3_NAEGR|nr:uncharacterized protein NAEGRDRAFT_75704 [Naegleria gruberi]EFC36568.1 predicted protein [Naegleria gruberi]|eukprot:XP_002669312.1 predicted protein [Naegleria gruberi strain NEG-M]